MHALARLARRWSHRIALIILALGLSLGLTATAIQPASAAAKSTATKKEYGKIKKGQSLAQVRKIIGASGTAVHGDMPGPVYVWRSTSGKNVYVAFLDGVVYDKARINDRTVSASEYRKLKRGISYSKTKKIIREGGHKVYDKRQGGKHIVGYGWDDDDSDYLVIVVFVDGKLFEKTREIG